MRLYYVNATVNEPGDFDLFVRAKSPAKAQKYWREYYDLDDEVPDSIDDVPFTGPEGPISWADVPLVGWQGATSKWERKRRGE